LELGRLRLEAHVVFVQLVYFVNVLLGLVLEFVDELLDLGFVLLDLALHGYLLCVEFGCRGLVAHDRELLLVEFIFESLSLFA
jgi:hypothetical protein